MAKIIGIDNGLVFIGMPDGTIKQFDVDDFEVVPAVGQNVEIYVDGGINVIGQKGSYNYVEKLTTNKVFYCLLALLFGGLGFHKFYAKKYAKGLLYLLFCWTYLPAIIAFFEFLGALFIPADKNGNIKV